MLNLSFEALVALLFHYRIDDDSSRTSYHPIHGIRALDINGKPFPKEPMTRANGVIPFPGVTATDITFHPRVWVKDARTNRQIWRDSKLISTSDNLIWICWDAIRRLAKVDYNAGDITIYAIRKSDADATDLIRANACELLSELPGSGVQQAIDFSSASSEHFYFKQIPAHYIETKMVFNLPVSLRCN
jgi:hypothetical protein